MKYYKYASVIEVQDLDRKPLDRRMVVLGKKVSEGCNVAPMTPGFVQVIHVEKLPYSMEEKEAWDYINTTGKAIFKYCSTKSEGGETSASPTSNEGI